MPSCGTDGPGAGGSDGPGDGRGGTTAGDGGQDAGGAISGFHIGVDVGGTKVLTVATAADDPARVLAEAEYPTMSGDGPLEVIDRTIAEVRRHCDDRHGSLRSIGVGMPGLVTRAGVLRLGPHLPGVRDADVAPRLARRHGVPAVADNDGNCAAWAEQVLGVGAGRHVDDMVFVGLGTGISCGLVVAGRRVRGVHGFAGEPGHMVVDPNGPGCDCGRRGCWEALASGSALAAQARTAAETGRLPSAVARAGGDARAVRGEHLTPGLRAGDADAVAVATAFARWVALGVVNLVHLLDPAVVALGGSVLSDPDPWMALVTAAYDELVLGGEVRPDTSIVAATLGRRAGAVGAALIGAESLH